MPACRNARSALNVFNSASPGSSGIRERVGPSGHDAATPALPTRTSVCYLGIATAWAARLARELDTQNVELSMCSDAPRIQADARVIIIAARPGSPAESFALQLPPPASPRRAGLIVIDEAWTPGRRLQALRAGCDHCLSACIEPEELAAIVLALARRVGAHSAPAILSWGPIRLDFIQGAIFVDGARAEMQPLQLRILGLLMTHAGEVVSHERLLDCVFRARPANASGSIARQISILRRQLGSARDLLVTVPSGYCLRRGSSTPPAAACG